MEQSKLKEILKRHESWLKGEGGERANLEGADLVGENLRNANLVFADFRNANLRSAKLEDANLIRSDLVGACLKRANLRNANLRGADLMGANLIGANLDYSCFPLWCGGINWIVDEKLPQMLAAFICSMNCNNEEIKEMQKMLLPYAKKSHRAKDILV